MSPRIKVPRKVLDPPIIKGFKPYGLESKTQNTEPVNLLYEEYESLRLSDYKNHNHKQASEIMGVSRPTFTRIYASCLQKIAQAFVEGRQIAIEGGKVYFDSNWYRCKKCTCYFNNPEKEKTVEHCPLCGSKQVKEFDYDYKSSDNDDNQCSDLCICPECGYEEEHKNGTASKKGLCPNCKIELIRK